MTNKHEYIIENLRKGIIVYSFTEKGICPNCVRELYENKFGNWICAYCHLMAITDKRRYLETLYNKWGIFND